MSLLGSASMLAANSAWEGLEGYLGVGLRHALGEVVGRLTRKALALEAALAAATVPGELRRVELELLRFRREYVVAETVIDFYGDAINTRTNEHLGACLRACDRIARRSMDAILGPLRLPVPLVLTYIDKGMGASILKAGLRLWDRLSISPVAAIKVARHNLSRPTAILHEAGHQVAHSTGWTPELADRLRTALLPVSPTAARRWASWASELAADCCAFVHAGWGAVAALHDVVANGTRSVQRVRPRDPHPVAWLRVLLGCAMCRRFYGAGPWDAMEVAWENSHPVDAPDDATRELLLASRPMLPMLVEILLRTPMRAFRGQALTKLVDPLRVRPDALDELERKAGSALFVSPHWLATESIRLLALSSYRATTRPRRLISENGEQRSWMVQLGGLRETSTQVMGDHYVS